jgi:predicted hydrocarbon binding protein
VRPYNNGFIVPDMWGYKDMFNEERDYCRFSWDDLGDIELGRPNLGAMVPVLVYRLLQYTLRDVLISEYDVKTANDIIFKAGKLAGEHFCRNVLNVELGLNEFVADLQKVLKELKIGILRVEEIDPESLEMTLTVAEDLDCSGLPLSEEVICVYDEGFISGILKEYTGKEFQAKEVECWATGHRVCRFAVHVLQPV